MKPHDPKKPGELRPLVVGRDRAAELIGISVRMLDELTKRGEIPSFTIGRRRLYSVAALEAWAMQRCAPWPA